MKEETFMMMKGTLLATVAGLALASTVSAAEPTRLSADQMDQVTAGLSLALAAFLTATAASSQSSQNESVSQESSGSASTDDSATVTSTSTTLSAKRNVSARKKVTQTSTACTGCQSAGLTIGVAGTLTTP
ncbi:MAG: hypothetical protein K6T74_04850 [Geminicoccaceae bacterium]|nr:hypothetical protein [Geminicoccaceae bacterium]